MCTVARDGAGACWWWTRERSASPVVAGGPTSRLDDLGRLALVVMVQPCPQGAVGFPNFVASCSSEALDVCIDVLAPLLSRLVSGWGAPVAVLDVPLDLGDDLRPRRFASLTYCSTEWVVSWV